MPSFLEGIGRIGDFSGVLNQFNYSNSNEEADGKAIMSDWIMVGKDLKAAMNTFSKEECKSSKKENQS
jgi:hypothetical protein